MTIVPSGADTQSSLPADLTDSPSQAVRMRQVRVAAVLGHLLALDLPIAQWMIHDDAEVGPHLTGMVYRGMRPGADAVEIQAVREWAAALAAPPPRPARYGPAHGQMRLVVDGVYQGVPIQLWADVDPQPPPPADQAAGDQPPRLPVEAEAAAAVLNTGSAG